jgi:hypothetical protein
MIRALLIGLGAIWCLTGLYVFIAPEAFYQNTPGLLMMGPFSVHFIRDVGLAYLASGGATVCGARRRVRTVALVGVAWPTLHALFHLQTWGHRGFPFDAVFAFDVAAVITPAMLAIAFALQLAPQPASNRR